VSGIDQPAVEGEIDWHYGPTDWDVDAGKMWHRACPAGRGEVWVWKDGSYTCTGCNTVQAPEGGWDEQGRA
jgi:hypothetical protein